MGKNQPTRKDSVMDLVVVAIVVVTMSMLVFQLGTNTLDILEQASATPAPVATVESSMPGEPTPTYDIGSVQIQE